MNPRVVTPSELRRGQARAARFLPELQQGILGSSDSGGSARGSGGPSAARHVMLLVEQPRFAAVVRGLAAPNERIGLDVVERPTQQGPLVVVAAKHDAIALGSPLHPDGGPEGRRSKHDGPLVRLGV